MRRRLTGAAVLAALLVGGMFQATTTASAAGQEPTASVAKPSDDVAHPGSRTEWWYASVIDPVSKQTFIATINSAPVPSTATFWYGATGDKTHAVAPTTPVVATEQPSVSSSAGTLSFDPVRGAYHLVYHANGYQADIWFDNALPGITGGPLNYDGQSMYWTAPVATSTVTGWVQPPNSDRVSVNGWRGYHDHNWGNFDLADQRYSGWEWAVSHEPDGSAALMGGVVAGDGSWQGVLARIEKTGTTGCLTSLTLSNWSTKDSFAYPSTVAAKTPVGARCNVPNINPAATFTVTAPYVVNTGAFAFTESVAQTVPGSVGLMEHFRTLSHGGFSTASPIRLP